MKQWIRTQEDILAEKVANEDMLEEYGVLYNDDLEIVAGNRITSQW